MNSYEPLIETKIPWGEGALERVFACLEKLDPQFQNFTTILIRNPKLEKYPNVDSGGIENPLRGSIVLPPSPWPYPTPEEISRLPGTLKVFDHRNAHEIGSLLFTIHNSAKACANFYTFAVIVLFNPPTPEIPLDASTPTSPSAP